jgi:ferredoxin
LRNKGKGGRRVYVSCRNKEKGAIAKKNCTVACIGCGKCAKACTFEAITVVDNLAYIDDAKCKLCRKCVTECPTGAILAVNFPVKREPTL